MDFGLVARALRVRTRRAWRQAVGSGEPLPADGGGLTDLLTFAPSLLQFGALAAFAQSYVLSVMQCVGPSMMPTLGLSGDVVLMWPTASGLLHPQLNDVVICSSPTDPSSTVCKRIVGLPGDVVRYRRLPGMPLLAGALGGRDANEHVQQVPPGQCWLQGDNAADSCDSRYYGPVPLSLVRGIVFVKLWPMREAGWISRTRPIERGIPVAAHGNVHAPAKVAAPEWHAGMVDGTEQPQLQQPSQPPPPPPQQPEQAFVDAVGPPADSEAVAAAWRARLVGEQTQPASGPADQ